MCSISVAATGYSAAVLGRLAASVVAVEADAGLAATARTALSATGATNVTVVEGAIETAGKAKGPYDVIIVEGAHRGHSGGAVCPA